VLVERPSARFADLAGIDSVLQDVRELIEYPLTHPEVYAHLGVEPPRGILLHGPPGCGKTLLANAVAGELGVAFLKISAPEVVSGMSGESEQKVRELFATARSVAPAIVFIDEVDAITPKRETASRGMERRIVAQLLTCLDALSLENTGGKPVLVIGATNRPDSLDAALRRAGRFDREISLGVPDQDSRKRILEVMTKKMRLSGDFDLGEIARITPGYVGADLASLTKEAAVLAINRIFAFLGGGEGRGEGGEGAVVPVEEAVSAALAATSITTTTTAAATAAAAVATPMEEDGKEERQGPATQEEAPSAAAEAADEQPLPPPSPVPQIPSSLSSPLPLPPHLLASLSITMADFLSAVKKVQPSSKREGFAAVPNVSWKDVGALSSVREELAMSIIEPISHPEDFLALGLTVPAGVLLFGPPGCGKTLLAKAIANESGANFISIKGPELLDKYVGESERAVRQVFTRARASAPCIIFFDELDALCPKRGMGGGGEGGGGSGVSERVVNQLLTEMDGLEGRRHVFVIAATNRPELIDPAMLRPGRLDKLLYVPLPGPEDRASILQAVCRGVAIDREEVDLDEVGRDGRAEGYSGADMAALVHEAGINVLREGREGGREREGGRKLMIGRRHFEAAFGRVPPSVSARDQERYLAMRHNLCRARGAAGGSGGVGGEEEREKEGEREMKEKE
jgi:ribosome biogenesis ATPase